MVMVYDPNKLNTTVNNAVGNVAGSIADTGLAAGNTIRNLPANAYTGVANMMAQPTGMRAAKPAYASPSDVNAAITAPVARAGTSLGTTLRELPDQYYDAGNQFAGQLLHGAIGSRGEEALSSYGQIPGNLVRGTMTELGRDTSLPAEREKYGVLAAVPHFGRALGRAAYDIFGGPTPDATAPTAPTAPKPSTPEVKTSPEVKPSASTAPEKATPEQMSIYSTPGDTSSLTIGLPNATGGKDTISSTDLAGMDRVYKGLVKRGGIGGMTPSAGGTGGGAGSFWANQGYTDANAWRADEQAKAQAQAQASQAAAAQAGRDQQLGLLQATAMETPDPSRMTWGEFGAAKARSKAAQGVLGQAVDLEKARMGDSAANAYRQAALDEQRAYHQGSLGMRQQELQDARIKAMHEAQLADIGGAKTLQEMADKQRAAETEAGMAQYLSEYNRPSTLWEMLPGTETPQKRAQRLYGGYKAAYEAANPRLLNKGY